MTTSDDTKVLVIGLDSFDPVLAQTWMDEGKLPHLAALMTASVAGRVQNPHGLEAASVWSSFSYGADPGVHGMADGSRDRGKVLAGKDCAGAPVVRPLWSILEDAGRRSIVIEVPVVPDSAAPTGIRVVNWFSHLPPEGSSRLALTTHPPELRDIIARDYAGDPLDGRMCDFHQPRTAPEQTWFRDALILRVRTKTALAIDLMHREPWDFFLVVFEDSHCAAHHSAHLVAPSGEDARIAAQIGNPLQTLYMAMDEAVGALVREAGGEATVLVFMSHGIEPAHTGLRLLDRILAKLNGELDEARNDTLTRARDAWRALPAPLRRMLRPLHSAIKQPLYGDGFLPASAGRKCHEVYTGERGSGIRINLAGRDPHGVIQPGAEYDAFCEWLIGEIGAVRNDGTGEKLAREIIHIRDHYIGPMSDTLPDLLVTWNRHAPIPSVSSPSIGRIRHPHPSIRTGDHSPDGFFLLAGPGFTPRRLNEDVPVIDLAPSLAALFGVRSASFQGAALEQLVPFR